jgi:hypothetical protein
MGEGQNTSSQGNMNEPEIDNTEGDEDDLPF